MGSSFAPTLAANVSARSRNTVGTAHRSSGTPMRGTSARRHDGRHHTTERIVLVVARHRVQHLDRIRDFGAEDRDTVEGRARGNDATRRHQPDRRLQTDDSVAGRGDATRPRGVGSEREGDETRRHRYRRPRTRPTADERGVDNAVPDAVGRTRARQPRGELVHVRLAHQQRTRVEQPGDRRSRHGCGVRERRAARRGLAPRHVDVVLHREGHAPEWALLAGSTRPGPQPRLGARPAGRDRSTHEGHASHRPDGSPRRRLVAVEPPISSSHAASTVIRGEPRSCRRLVRRLERDERLAGIHHLARGAQHRSHHGGTAGRRRSSPSSSPPDAPAARRPRCAGPRSGPPSRPIRRPARSTTSAPTGRSTFVNGVGDATGGAPARSARANSPAASHRARSSAKA